MDRVWLLPLGSGWHSCGDGLGHHLVIDEIMINDNSSPTWDLNGDHAGDIAYVALIGLRWQETGALGWIPEDANADGIVDIADVALVGTHWQET